MTMKTACLILELKNSSKKYKELNLKGVFPYYLVSDGDKTVIEKKLDDMISDYDDIYVVVENPTNRALLINFLKHDSSYDNIKIVISMKNIRCDKLDVIINFEEEALSENDQITHLYSLKSSNTCRFFNSIEFKGEEVVKTAKTEAAIKLQEIENKFYDAYGDTGVLAKKIGYDSNKHKLILEKVNGVTAQKWYHDNGNVNDLILKVSNALVKLNITDIDVIDSNDDILRSIYSELIEKINNRVRPCKSLIKYFLDKSHVEEIDGMEITQDYDVLMNRLSMWFSDNRDEFQSSVRLCHGDPNTDNTMIDKRGNVVFIDPRGYFGDLKTLGLGLPQYDLAKFCYGLNGYSVFNSAPYVNIKYDTYNSIKVVYPTVGKSITQIDLDDMCISTNTKIIIGIIWMKLTSYIINDPMKSVIAYLYGNAICTKYLTELGYFKDNY